MRDLVFFRSPAFLIRNPFQAFAGGKMRASHDKAIKYLL